MPDNRFRFLPALIIRILRLCRSEGIKVVLITSPPNSMSLLLPLLRWCGLRLPLVLDVRDMWALDPLMTPDNAWFRGIQRRLERFALKRASAVVTVTPGYQSWLAEALPQQVPVHLITNGYDEEDWAGLMPERVAAGRVLISHAGSLGGINGPRSVKALAQALKLLASRRPELGAKLAFQFMGTVPLDQQAALRRLAPESDFHFPGFLSHQRTLARLAASDILLLMHFDLPFCDVIYPGKLFEYYRLGLPILACTPPGLVESFVKTRNLGACAPYEDSRQIAKALEELVDGVLKGERPQAKSGDLGEFERGKIARRYGVLLKSLISQPAQPA